MNGIERTSSNSARTSRQYSAPANELLTAVRRAIEKLPRWNVESASGNELKATRTTRVLRFKDDVTIRVEDLEVGSQAEISSASRVGKSDLGQNPRNIQEFLDAIQSELAAKSE